MRIYIALPAFLFVPTKGFPVIQQKQSYRIHFQSKLKIFGVSFFQFSPSSSLLRGVVSREPTEMQRFRPGLQSCAVFFLLKCTDMTCFQSMAVAKCYTVVQVTGNV